MMNTKEKIRPLTQALCQALRDDQWPSEATCVDFGIKTASHLGALQYALVSDGVTPEQLDKALGNGPALQALISPTNPYRNVTFLTSWDELEEEPDEF